MRILVLDSLRNPEKSRLKIEAQKRRHKLDIISARYLTLYSDTYKFEPTIGGIPLSKFDVIYFANLGFKRWEWIASARFLLENTDTKIVDDYLVSDRYSFTPTPTMTYLIQSKNKLPMPKTIEIFKGFRIDNLIKMLKDYQLEFPMIVKDSMVHQGKGINKVENEEELLKAIENHNSPRPLVIREFIPNDGDIRVFCIGFKAIGAMNRTPKEGDFRSNISIGGTGSPFDLDKNSLVRELAEKSARLTGIQIAGVDIIIDRITNKPYILEVNDGPGFKGLEKYTRINVASKIIEYFESLL